MRRRLPGWVLVLMLMTASHAQAMAVDAVTLQDPALEARARILMQGLRCLVCQNQSIEISDAELAGDLRRIVRERIAAGDTDDQVRAHLVARYGDWVLMRPPVKPSTLVLWAGPPVLLILGGVALWMTQKKRKDEPEPPPLTEAEKAQLRALSGSD
ncbi:MAG: cytochrome c-type biogenesis protein CcmH [Alphaproteobacteria bacterium]|nr:cytochrome c-type biogenesis protein CcmH [Alphaproteobacteria bacterium]